MERIEVFVMSMKQYLDMFWAHLTHAQVTLASDWPIADHVTSILTSDWPLVSGLLIG